MTDPTPATPDEAVARMVDLLRAEFDQGHMMVMEPIAERVLALSRQQGDTVAARVEDVARRMHARSQDPASWDAVPDHDWWLREAALLLGIGADGAGER